ncbi:hypothetical protein ACP70R_038449 [Stipagrostis hirtigluma subsp. patula]
MSPWPTAPASPAPSPIPSARLSGAPSSAHARLPGAPRTASPDLPSAPRPSPTAVACRHPRLLLYFGADMSPPASPTSQFPSAPGEEEERGGGEQ